MIGTLYIWPQKYSNKFTLLYSTDPIRIGYKADPDSAFYLNADLDPGRQTNADLCGSGSESRARIFKRLWSPGIDSKASIPPAYVAWRAGTITLFDEAARQATRYIGWRYLSLESVPGLLKRLQIRALIQLNYVDPTRSGSTTLD